MKLSDAEEEDLEEAADPLCAGPAPARPTHAMSSASVMHCPQDHHPSPVHVHLCPPEGKWKPPEGTPLESRGTPLQEKADAHEQFSKVGCGPGPARLWNHTAFGHNKLMKKQPSATGQSSTSWGPILNIRTSRSGKFIDLCDKAVIVNALHLELAQPKLPLKELELGRKSPQRTKKWYLARLAELKQWSQDSKLEPQDVKSDSGSSVASSVAALKFWKSVCGCDSSEEDEPYEYAPKCSSLTTSGIDGDNESVGSTSSVAESAIERFACRAHPAFLGSSWTSGPSLYANLPLYQDGHTATGPAQDGHRPETRSPPSLQQHVRLHGNLHGRRQPAAYHMHEMPQLAHRRWAMQCRTRNKSKEGTRTVVQLLS